MEGPRQRNVGKVNIPSEVERDRREEEEAVRKASASWVKSFLIAFPAAVLLSILVVCLIPSPIKPVEMPRLPDPRPFEGVLKQNNILTYSERIYRNHVTGPESIVVDGDYIYTGTADGWVNVIHAGVVKKLVRFGKEPCGGPHNENTCGRPLGMRMGKDGLLVVLDAYHGLFKVNVVTGDYTILYSSSTPVNGKRPKMLNDLDIGPDGKIYFSDSSSRWGRNQFMNIYLEGAGTGRLLQYDPSTKEVTQLLGGLVFANGVQLTKDKKAVLVAETAKARVLKFDLKTKKSTVWAENLPGYPDNIRYSSSSGTYWLGLSALREGGKSSLGDFLADKPWARGMLAKFMSVSVYSSLKRWLVKSSSVAMAIELNPNGDIVRSIHDPSGKVIEDISEAHDINGVLYFGSFNAPYIGRLFKKKVPNF